MFHRFLFLAAARNERRSSAVRTRASELGVSHHVDEAAEMALQQQSRQQREGEQRSRPQPPACFVQQNVPSLLTMQSAMRFTDHVFGLVLLATVRGERSHVTRNKAPDAESGYERVRNVI